MGAAVRAGGVVAPVGSGPAAPVPSPTPGGLVGRFLRDPGGWTHRLTHRLLADLASWGRASIVPAIMLAAAVLAVTAMWLVVGRRRRGRQVASSVFVAIRPPEQPDPAGGRVFWSYLGEHLSARRSFGARRPAAIWQVIADPGGVRLGVELSGTVNADAVCRMVASAWPGATAIVVSRPELSAAGEPVVGGRLRMAGAGWLPLNISPAIDPLRLPLSVLGNCQPGEQAVLRIAVRPASRRSIRKAHRQVKAVETGRPANLLARLIDVLPVVGTPPATRAAAARRPVDPFRAELARAGREKLADGRLFDISVDYAVNGGGLDKAARRRRVQRVTELGHAFGAFAGHHNRLIARRQRRPAKPADGSSGKGFLVGTSELAALAHLPADPAAAGISVSGAQRILPPAEVSYF